jgi:SAM-dependent methyltransferase
MTIGVPDNAGDHFQLFYDPDLTRPTPYDDSGDYFQLARPRIDRTFDLIRDAVRGSHILDVGASPFYLLDLALAGGATRASGIYFSRDDHPLRAHPTIYSRYGEIELHHADLEANDLPFADGQVDVLTACEILEHFDYFPLRFANEVRRVLRPGGLLCLTVPNVASVGNIAKLLLNKNIYMKYRDDHGGRHKHEYTMAQLRAFVRFLEFDEVAHGVMPFVTSRKRLPGLGYRLVSALPLVSRYAPKLYIIARRPAKLSHGLLTRPPSELYDPALSIEA